MTTTEGTAFWHQIIGAEAFDLCPPGVDEAAWRAFQDRFRRAESLDPTAGPVQLDLELNGGCNMACPFCVHGYEAIPNALLDGEVARRLIREAVALDIRSLKLNCINEPLLRRDLEDIVDYAVDAGIFNVYFVTNGILLTEARRARLLASRLTKVQVSIDAATADTYDLQRRSGQFARVVENTRALIRERNAAGSRFPVVMVSFLVNASNQHEAARFRDEWVGVADVVSFQRMNEVPDRETGLVVDHTAPRTGCKFPAKQVVVDHRGRYRPCCKLAGEKLAQGDVSTSTLADAWEQFADLRSLHAEGRWTENEVCRRCIVGAG